MRSRHFAFVICVVLASRAFGGEIPMVRMAGSPAEVGKTWGETNKDVIAQTLKIHYVEKAAAAGISEDVLLDRAKVFLGIVQKIAPHWIEETKAAARAAGVREDLYLAFVACRPRNLFLHECTSYAVARQYAEGNAIFFHKTRDNVDRDQAAYILESSVKGIHKFIGVCDASSINCSMMVNDQGLAGSSDYPAHLTRKKDPNALVPEAAKPQYRGMMGGSMLRYVAEKASNCREALAIIEDLVKKGYYAGGDVNGNHWLLVDRKGTILEVSNNARHVASRFHTQKVYFSRLDESAAGKRLRGANEPIGFALFHQVARDRSICFRSSIAGMTVEIDPVHPELFTCAWVSLPVRSGSFPLLMGQTKFPVPSLNGEINRLSKQTKGKRQTWETLEQTTHADKQRLQKEVLAGMSTAKATQTAETLNQWSRKQTAALLERLASPDVQDK